MLKEMKEILKYELYIIILRHSQDFDLKKDIFAAPKPCYL